MIRLVDALSALGVGVLASVLAMQVLWSFRLGWPAAGLVLLAAATVLLILSATGRVIGARHGESLGLSLALPARALAMVLGPMARFVAREAFAPPRPPLEEMERALSEYARSPGNTSSESTTELIHAVFEFREKVARDVMVPRTEILAIDIDTPVPEILRVLAEEGHSRIPVYRGNLDAIIGTLHARDLVPLTAHPELIVLRDVLRPPTFVPWSKPVEHLLREMQRRHIHMTMVVDEYGGVMGLCTLEDVLAEIVGEIGDEFGTDDHGRVEAHPDGTFTVRGDATIEEFNRETRGALPERDQYETIAGFLNVLAGAIPSVGDRFFHDGWLFTVSEADARHVLEVRAVQVKRPAVAQGQPPRAS